MPNVKRWIARAAVKMRRWLGDEWSDRCLRVNQDESTWWHVVCEGNSQTIAYVRDKDEAEELRRGGHWHPGLARAYLNFAILSVAVLVPLAGFAVAYLALPYKVAWVIQALLTLGYGLIPMMLKAEVGFTNGYSRFAIPLLSTRQGEHRGRRAGSEYLGLHPRYWASRDKISEGWRVWRRATAADWGYILGARKLFLTLSVAEYGVASVLLEKFALIAW